MNYTIQDLLAKVVEVKGSDLHIVVDSPPVIRSENRLEGIPGTEKLSSDEAKTLIYSLLNDEQRLLLEKNKEIDFSFSYKEVGRFRANAFHQKGNVSLALRLIPYKIPSFEELNLPEFLLRFTEIPQGLILVTGPTGQGKSTTIASMIEHINVNRQENILTIEDPIEYMFQHKKSLIQQRELHQDTNSWDRALRSALREDPNIVLIGEMRDFKTISSALTIAETGHLVFATLHTNSAPQTIDRIIDVFPEHQQAQVRTQLALVVEGVISQRLVPGNDGNRYPAVEVMTAAPAVRNLIREGKTHQIDNVISTSSDLGMVSLERSLAALVDSGVISYEEAQHQTTKPTELARLIKK